MTSYNHTNLTLYGIWRLPTKYDRRTDEFNIKFW